MTNLANLLVLFLASGSAMAQLTVINGQSASAPQQPVNNGQPVFQFNPRADASALAEKYLAMIKEEPQCDKFRAQVQRLAGGSPYDTTTPPRMALILQQARRAGCHA